MKDKTTTNKDGSTTVVREMEEPVSKPFLDTDSIPEMVARSLAAATGCEMDPMDEMRHREEDAELDKLEAKINDPYPDSIPFDEEPRDARPTGADLEGDWMKPEVGKLRRENELLKAHLNSKGYGHAAIRRILAGEVVR